MDLKSFDQIPIMEQVSSLATSDMVDQLPVIKQVSSLATGDMVDEVPVLEQVSNIATCDRAARPHFQSIPSEIRIMIYRFLLDPTRRSVLLNHWKLHYRSHNAPLTTTMGILCVNSTINQEALPVLYCGVILVSIDWDASERAYLSLFRREQDVRFHFVRPDAPMPPCVVHIRQQYDDDSSKTTRASTIIAAADFAAICALMQRSYLVPQPQKRQAVSYSVISLPKVGYQVEMLRELIWTPLLALRERPSGVLEDRAHRNIKAIDCTGVFEQAPAVSDWNSMSDDEDELGWVNEGDEDEIDGHGSETDITADGHGIAEDGEDGEDVSEISEDWTEEDWDEEDWNEEGCVEEEIDGEDSEEGR